MNKLSVIMPAYNEEKTIEQIIEKVMEAGIPGIQKELIVVDDGSTDRTANIVRRIQSRHANLYLLSHPENRGKGAAVRTGVDKADGNIIIIQDADLEYEPEDYLTCITPILEKRAKVVYGSRMLIKDQQRGRFDFFLGGLVVTCVTNILFSCRLTDEPTCYKTFDADFVKGIQFKGNRFEWEPEITARILKRGEKIIEVPIHYRPRKKGEGKKINWKDGLRAMYCILTYHLF